MAPAFFNVVGQGRVDMTKFCIEFIRRDSLLDLLASLGQISSNAINVRHIFCAQNIDNAQ
jgi:hypothetical protein